MQKFLFIDGSYLIFYKYHALVNWWKLSHPDDPLIVPIENKEFVDKFIKTLHEKIKEIPKKLKLGDCTIIIAKDCSRNSIWRKEIFPEYKENRIKDATFLGGPFFKLAYDEIFPNNDLIHTVIQYDKLEADDCIAISTRYILENSSDKNIYIITSDMDYLQLIRENVEIYNLKYKKINDSKTSFNDPKKDLFCKIVMGDKSDNIPSIIKKCGIKTAEKMYACPELFIKKMNEDNVNELYKRNSLLIDFNRIPLKFVNGLKKKLKYDIIL